MIDEELVRLIREVVKQEMKVSRASLPEIGGAGGNTVISSRGDIVLTPGVGRHAYYQKDTGRVEIGGGGSIWGSGTVGYIPKFTPYGTTLGNSLLSESGTIISSTATVNMIAGKSTQYYELNGHLAGYIQGIYTTDQEVVDNLGILIQGKYHSGGSPPTIYAGDSGGAGVMGPPGSGSYGIHLTEIGIGIKPDATKDIFLITSGGGKAYYNGTELLTGGGGIGGSGSVGYIPKFTPDGTTLGNSIVSETLSPNILDISGKLTLDDSITLEGTTPYIYLYSSAASKGYVSWVSGTGMSVNSQSGDLILGAPTSTSILAEIAGTTVLTVTGSLITATVAARIGSQGTITGGTSWLDLVCGSGTVAFNVYDDNDFAIPKFRVMRNGNVGIKITDPASTFVVNGGVNIGGNAAVADNNLSVEGTVTIKGGSPGVGKVLTSDANGLGSWETGGGGSYLPLTGGTLTGNLIIEKSNPLLTIKGSDASSPVLDFRDSANNVDAQLYTTVANDTVLVSNSGGLYLSTAVTNGGSVFLETKDVTRLTIADSLITAAVALAMGTYNITGTGDVLPHATGSHDCGNSTYRWSGVESEFFVAWTSLLLKSPDEATYGEISYTNAEHMVFTVASGGVFEFVVN